MQDKLNDLESPSELRQLLDMKNSVEISAQQVKDRIVEMEKELHPANNKALTIEHAHKMLRLLRNSQHLAFSH